MRPKPHQRPYPPVLLGGVSPRILDRIAAWGDDWIPGVAPVAEVGEGRDQLFTAAASHDRDPDEFTLVVFGPPGTLRETSELAELRELDVHHTTIWLEERGDGVFSELEALARVAYA